MVTGNPDFDQDAPAADFLAASDAPAAGAGTQASLFAAMGTGGVMDALLTMATAQEKFYLQCNRYATAIGAAPNCAGTGTLQGAAASKNGWYTLAVVAATATTFTVSAVATAGQAQFTDTACRTFLMTGAGLRTATNSGGADNTAECWR